MNFILFNPDEMRAESAGCYGHPLAPTPNLDRLAAQGTRFDQCHVQHTVCSPSRCSFMTGWYAHVRGHRSLWHLLQPDEPNLLKYLKQAGYDVRWWGKNDLLAQASFADSVTSASGHGTWHHGVNPHSPEDPRFYSFLYTPGEKPIAEHGDYANVMQAVRYLESGPTQPFCLYLPLSFPHCPYSAPQPWHDMVDPDALPPLRPPAADRRPTYHGLIRRTRRLDELDDPVLRRINAVYLGMIGFLDHMLGLLLDALERTGHADDTTVLFFSDHGDYAGDYGLVEKWTAGLEDVLTRVPLVIRQPGGTAGHAVGEPTELFDIVPTVLSLAGIEPGHTHFARSLTGQLAGQPGDPGRHVFAEGGYEPFEPQCFENVNAPAIRNNPAAIYYPKIKLQEDHPSSIARCAMIRSATHKLVHRPSDQCELYDLTTDPRELHNRYDDPTLSPVQRDLERRLLDWYVQTSDVTPWRLDPRGRPRAN